MNQDRRRHERMPFCRLIRFCSMEGVTHEGILKDISLGGCRVESTVKPHIGSELDCLHISMPNHIAPLIVDRAIVRWARQGEFGVTFVTQQPEHQERLHRLLSWQQATSPVR